jgi:hypothetical protein
MTKLIVAFRNFATAPKNDTKTLQRRHHLPNFSISTVYQPDAPVSQIYLF